jgi:hypothetical protein
MSRDESVCRGGAADPGSSATSAPRIREGLLDEERAFADVDSLPR